MGAPIDDLGFQARLQPDRLAAVDLSTQRRWSYAELDSSVGRCVRVLLEHLKLSAGERIASLAKNSVTLAILHLACARCGLIYVPLNWRLSKAENTALLADAEPTVLITDSRVDAVHTTVRCVDLNDLQATIDAATAGSPAAHDDHLPSLILYTSGTSGHPKGVLLSESNISQTAMNFGLLGRVTSDSVFLIDTPMFHIIGLITCVRPPLRHGGAFVVSDGFDPVRTLERLADSRLGITHYFCVPQMAAALRKSTGYDPAALKALTGIFTGGAPHPAADIRAWLTDGISVVDGYGMSEAGTVFGMPIERSVIERKAGSVGIAPPWVESMIVDEQGEECPDEVAGELWLRGANITHGYWRRPDETAKSFTAAGWFRTGDIVVRDGDGFYRVVDRKKDMFISGGENVYPAEIEALLATIEGLQEFAVIGVPNEQWGEVGHAILVLATGASLTGESIRAHLASCLARYKVPKYFSFIDALPRTGSGKIQKNALRSRFSG